MQTTHQKTVNRPASAQPAAAPAVALRKAGAPSLLSRLQASMRVSSPHDAEEREADASARKISRMALPGSESRGTLTGGAGVLSRKQGSGTGIALPSPRISRFAGSGILAKHLGLQRKSDGRPDVSSTLESDIQGTMAAGSPLPSGARRFMEPRFRADFSNVRIHTGERSARITRQLNARAFTLGNQVFFGRDQFRPESDEGRELIAHELTHTIQQGVSVQRSPEVTFTTSAAPHIQRSAIGEILDWCADKANGLPGFPLLTMVLGVNPVNMRSVDRSTENVLRALIQVMPGSASITRALDNHKLFSKVAAWIDKQVKTLGMVGASFRSALTRFLDSLGLSDLAPWNWESVWNRAKSIFTAPIDRLTSFAKGLVTDIVKFVKDAILRPLAALAQGTPGYDLLKAILGQDPITGDRVPRNAETLIGGFMKLIGQEDVWENIKKGKAVERAWAWFNGALAALRGLVAAVPGRILTTFTSLTIIDVVTVAGAFIKIARAFAGIAGEFIAWGLTTVWNLLEIVFDVVKPGLMGYIRRTGAALKSILKNPLPFVGNLVRAAKLGFTNFLDRFKAHFMAGLVDWLTGSLEGVYIPKALTLIELGRLALSILGITWAQIRGKIVKALGAGGEIIMKALETGFDIVVALVTGGPAAAWELIKEKLTDLKDTVVSGIVSFVTDTIIKKAVPKLIAMFIPGAGFISAIISIYDTIMVFVQKIAKIIQVVTAFIDSIVTIAAGNIGAAAKRVETILGGLVSLAISFLAGFLGLGKVADKIKAVIEKVRTAVDKALDAAIAWIIAKAKSLLGKLFGKDKKDERTPEQKQSDLDKAMAEAEAVRGKPGVTEAEIINGLKPIKTKYRMASLALVVDARSEADETVHIEGEINPAKKSPPQKITSLSALNIPSEPPVYSSADPDLGGVEMTANFLTPKHPNGSGVSVKPPIMDKIPKTRDGTRLYVQGHLLNRLLGGPGNTIDNLTPLTYQANGDHERNAESHVKALVNDQHKAVKYVVKAYYPSRSKADAPNVAEGRLATRLVVSWHTWDIVSVNPLKKQKGSEGKENVPIWNVPPWPHV